MSYVDTFTGSTVSPEDVSYLSLSLTASTTLQWPSLNSDTGNVAARLIEMTASAGGFNLALPPANQTGVGNDILFRNTGSFTITVTDTGGNTVSTVASGEAKYVYLINNSTANGIWHVVAFGVGSSSADAATLAGYGLKAISTTLNQNHPTSSISSGTAILTTDRAKLFLDTVGVTVTLPLAATAGNDFFILIRNASNGSTTVACSGGDLLDGSASQVMQPSESMMIVCSGTGWYSVGRGRSTTFAFTQLTKSIAGSSNVTLTASETGYPMVALTGAMTAAVTVYFQPVTSIWYIQNQTTGGFGVTIQYSNGSGGGTGTTVSIPASGATIVYGNGTNMSSALTTAASTAAFTDGSAGSPSITFAADTDTGFYRVGTNQVGIAAGGANVATFAAGGFTDTGTGTFGGLLTAAGVTTSGSLTFNGTTLRITGDFSNATVANRTMFQTSTVDENTAVSAMPNGSGHQAWFNAYNSSTPDTAASALTLGITNTVAWIGSGVSGAGSYLPMTFYTGGAQRLAIDTSGNVTQSTSVNGALTHGITNTNVGASAYAQQLLSVNGGLLWISKYGSGGGGVGFVQSTGGSLAIGTTDGYVLNLVTNGATQATIQTDGRWDMKYYKETMYGPTNASGYSTIILTNGTIQWVTLNQATTTFVFPTAVAGLSFQLACAQDATGGRVITWPGSVKWPGGTAPTLSGASKLDVFSFWSDGTSWFGSAVGKNY